MRREGDEGGGISCEAQGYYSGLRAGHRSITGMYILLYHHHTTWAIDDRMILHKKAIDPAL